MRRVTSGWGNCITVVRNAGYAVPRTKDGYARTVPVTSTKLPPVGKKVVVKTSDSWMGHVSVAVLGQDGKLRTTIDSAFGSGRVIPLARYRGYI